MSTVFFGAAGVFLMLDLRVVAGVLVVFGALAL